MSSRALTHIHFGPVEDQGLVARKIGEADFKLFASAAYLDRTGRPKTPADLANHDFICFTGRDMVRRWTLTKDGISEHIDLNCHMRINNSDAVREAAISGLGMVIAPVWLFADFHQGGPMEVVLADYESKSLPMFAVYPSRRFVPPKVRAAIDFLSEQYRSHPIFTNPDETLLCKADIR